LCCEFRLTLPDMPASALFSVANLNEQSMMPIGRIGKSTLRLSLTAHPLVLSFRLDAQLG